jgi:hypothetical protein
VLFHNRGFLYEYDGSRNEVELCGNTGDVLLTLPDLSTAQQLLASLQEVADIYKTAVVIANPFCVEGHTKEQVEDFFGEGLMLAENRVIRMDSARFITEGGDAKSHMTSSQRYEYTRACKDIAKARGTHLAVFTSDDDDLGLSYADLSDDSFLTSCVTRVDPTSMRSLCRGFMGIYKERWVGLPWLEYVDAVRQADYAKSLLLNPVEQVLGDSAKGYRVQVLVVSTRNRDFRNTIAHHHEIPEHMYGDVEVSLWSEELAGNKCLKLTAIASINNRNKENLAAFGMLVDNACARGASVKALNACVTCDPITGQGYGVYKKVLSGPSTTYFCWASVPRPVEGTDSVIAYNPNKAK